MWNRPLIASSANMRFTIAWASSKLPSIAMLCTFGAMMVVIWRRWTSLTRPLGWSMKISTRSRPATALIAALPVSPLVAPTIVR